MKKISIILSVIISSVIFSNSINTVNEKIEISQTVDQISYKANISSLMNSSDS